MHPDFNIDFSEQIKSKELDLLTYKGPNSYPGEENKKFKYLNIDLKPLLNFPPPLNSSERTKLELLEVKKTTELEHPESFTSKLKDMDDDPTKFVYQYYEKLSGQKLPRVFIEILNGGDVETLAMKLKVHYKRPRPYELALHHDVYFKYNKKIQKKGTAGTPSYPSGHTMAAYFAAYVASYAKPELRNKLMKRAEMVARSRIYEGVHFPSDNQFSIFLVENVLMPAFLKKV